MRRAASVSSSTPRAGDDRPIGSRFRAHRAHLPIPSLPVGEGMVDTRLGARRAARPRLAAVVRMDRRVRARAVYVWAVRARVGGVRWFEFVGRVSRCPTGTERAVLGHAPADRRRRRRTRCSPHHVRLARRDSEPAAQSRARPSPTRSWPCRVWPWRRAASSAVGVMRVDEARSSHMCELTPSPLHPPARGARARDRVGG